MTIEKFFWIKTFIHFKCCYKIYLNIVSLQLIVFKIIIVYNKWKKVYLILSLNLLSFSAPMLKVSCFLCFLYRPSCFHLKKKKEKKLAQLIEKDFQIEKERKSSLKFAGRNQNAICSSCFIFLFANHKKITLLGSQREK